MKALLRSIGIAFACCAVFTWAALAQAKFPNDKISIIVPYSAGNGLDLLGREYAEGLAKELGVLVIVENRDGAAGVIGTNYVVRAPADGYTILFTANPPFVVSPQVMAKPPYNPQTSLVPLARVGSVPLVLVTASKSPFKSFEQMKVFVRKHPEQANYASAGIGSPGQIYGELLNDAADLKLQEVPYKATGQALTDVISGSVLLSLVSVTAASPHIKGGTLRVLAVGSKRRLSDMPDVPTLAESLGRKDFVAGVWYGFFAPSGLPKERVERLYTAIASVAAMSRLGGFMKRSMMEPELLDPRTFASTLTADVDTARGLVESGTLRSR